VITAFFACFAGIFETAVAVGGPIATVLRYFEVNCTSCAAEIRALQPLEALWQRLESLLQRFERLLQVVVPF
jgi:hypothetical protein